METNLVVKFFEGVAKFFYALLPTVLPYSTPLPIAVITAGSAEKFFGMDPVIAGVFVFSLEGLGVWSTTTFVDKFTEWTRSKNRKVLYIWVGMLVVVIAYLAILIMLNVVLKGDNSNAYRWAVALVCFLPFIAGILNGVRKVDLFDKDMFIMRHNEELDAKEKARQDRKELRKAKLLAEHGFDPREIARTQAETAATQSAPKEKHAGDYKDFVMDLLTQNGGNLTPRQITDAVNKAKRVQLVHSQVKGTWGKWINEWKRGGR